MFLILKLLLASTYKILHLLVQIKSPQMSLRQTIDELTAPFFSRQFLSDRAAASLLLPHPLLTPLS
jgi:hypothetical protein